MDMNVVGNGGYPQIKWTFKGENSDESVDSRIQAYQAGYNFHHTPMIVADLCIYIYVCIYMYVCMYVHIKNT